MPPSILSRAWRFVLPIFPEWVEDGEYGDYQPPAPPESLHVSFGRGQVQLAEDQDGAPEGTSLYEYIGLVECRMQVTAFALSKWLPDARFEKTTVPQRQQNLEEILNESKKVKTCMPLGWAIGGDLTAEAGKRNDLLKIQEILKKEGPIAGVKRVAEEFPGQYMRYHGGIEKMANLLETVPRDTDFQPNPFQSAMIDELKRDPHPRHIYWVYDAVGHSGKSRLLKHLACEMDAIELGGREVDIAFGYNGQRIVCFDIPRPTPLTAYADAFICAERLKNGGIFSTKFFSKFKRFAPPHVVFFSNLAPPEGLWTKDRLQLITLSPPPQPFSPFTIFGITPPEPEPVEESRADFIKNRILELS